MAKENARSIVSRVGPRSVDREAVALGSCDGDRAFGRELLACGDRDDAGENDQVVTRELNKGVCSDAVAWDQ